MSKPSIHNNSQAPFIVSNSKIHINSDGTIDYNEFAVLGKYILTEYDQMVKRVPPPLKIAPELLESTELGKESEKSTKDLGLDPSEEIFAAVRPVIISNYWDQVGPVDYFGDQIMSYVSENLTSFPSFCSYFSGTVFASIGLWVKMGFLCALTTCTAFYSRYQFNEQELNLVQLSDFLVGLDTLLAVFAGFYIENMVGRWWAIRCDGVGQLTKSVADLVMICATFVHGDEPEDDAIRHLIMRYGLLAHALTYMQAQNDPAFSCSSETSTFTDPHAKFLSFVCPRSYVQSDDGVTNRDQNRWEPCWQDLKERGLIIDKEIEILEKTERKCQAVWAWILSFLMWLAERGVIDPERFEQMAEIAREGRRAGALVLLHIECQVPMPYVHVVCFMTNVYQVAFAIVTGIVISAGMVQENMSQLVYQQILQFVLFMIIYQGILETVEKMSNPLGNDDIDFPQLYIHLHTQEECVGLIDTCRMQPWDVQRMTKELLNRIGPIHDPHANHNPSPILSPKRSLSRRFSNTLAYPFRSRRSSFR